MKLPVPRTFQQLLFASTLFVLICEGKSQAPAPAVAAPDKVVLKDGRSQNVKVVRVIGSDVELQVGTATAKLPLANIGRIEMEPPVEFVAASAALNSGDYAKALVGLKPLVDKFRGLPADWAQQAAAMIGDAYLGLNDAAKATAAFDDFQKAYPGQSTMQGDVAAARVAVAKKDFATAKSKLEAVTAKALTEVPVPKTVASTYSQAFFLSGQVKEAEGDLPGALQDYLRTVTVFSADATAVDGAQKKADALRLAAKGRNEKVVAP